MVDSDQLFAGGSVDLRGARSQVVFLLLPSVGFSVSGGLGGLPHLFLLRLLPQLVLRNLSSLLEFDPVKRFLLHFFDIQQSITMGVVMPRGAFPGDLEHLARIELLLDVARAFVIRLLCGRLLFDASLFGFDFDILVVHHQSFLYAEVAD